MKKIIVLLSVVSALLSCSLFQDDMLKASPGDMATPVSNFLTLSVTADKADALYGADGMEIEAAVTAGQTFKIEAPASFLVVDVIMYSRPVYKVFVFQGRLTGWVPADQVAPVSK